MEITDTNTELVFFRVEVTIVLRDPYFKERGQGSDSHKVIPYELFQMDAFVEQDESTLLECIFAMLNDSEHPMFDDSWKDRSLSTGDIVIFPNGHAWECQSCGWGMIDKW